MASKKTGDPGGKVVSITKKLDAAKEAFAPFLAANPLSSVADVVRRGEKRVEIVDPWGDSSVGITLPSSAKDLDLLAKSLEHVFLPPRLTALWHSDTNELEVIWTAFNLSGRQADIKGRQFTFEFKGRKHECEFRRSSDRLLVLTKHAYPKTTSETNWRNIQSFSHFASAKNPQPGFLGDPLSFWVNNIKYNEESTIELISNLNFYISYFDEASPTAFIHPPKEAATKNKAKQRYIMGKFPEEIVARNLDNNLINFWLGAMDQNPLIRFVIYYRILEYSASHYMDALTKSHLRRVFANPSKPTELESVITQVAELMTSATLNDENKIRGVLASAVEPKLIWPYIADNIDYFSKEISFDGGFKIDPLFDKGMTLESFCSCGLEAVQNRAARIRNAMSHGRDLATKGVITPTTRNIRQLLPWVHLMGTVAAEVVLYEGVT